MSGAQLLRVAPAFRQQVAGFRSAVRANTPRRTGLLSRSISMQFGSDNISARVFADASISPYAGFVVAGTKRHDIFPSERKALRWATSGGFAFAKHVTIPARRPNSFIRRTWREYRKAFTRKLLDSMLRIAMGGK